MNIFDYIIIGVVVISILISLLRGFLKESISLIIWILGFWVAIKFYSTYADMLTPYIDSETIRLILSFAGLFLSVWVFGALFNYLLSFIIDKTGLSGFDRVLGVFFGCVRGILLISVALLLISSTSFAQDTWWKESVLIPHFQVLVDWLRIFLPQQFTNLSDIIN